MKNGDAHPTLFLEANPVGKLQKLLDAPKEPLDILTDDEIPY
jgi:hypothetical protein